MTHQHFLSIPIRLGLVLALLAATLGVLPAPVARAATITVNSTLDNTIAGDGNCTLREAINNANADADTTGGDCAAGTGNDTITVPANTYTLTGAAGDNANNSGDLDILAAGGDLTINGAGAGSTIIDGNNNDRVFHVCPGGGCANTVTFNGVTIRNGSVPLSGGGGIRNEGGTTTVDASSVISNTALNGGGISNFATLTVTNSTIGGVGAGNRAMWGSGGGIYNYAGTTTVDASSVISNTATNNGGGIWNQVTLNVQNGSTIGGAGVGNQATDGGGIYNFAGTVTITDSTLSDNEAGEDGGGIYNEDNGTVTITNSTIYSNTTGGHGGGIYNNDGNVALYNSTVHSNTSGDEGGGIYSDGEGGGATLTLNRCTVSGNTANSTDYGGGGGIYLYYSSAALTNTTVSGNDANTEGGGISTLSDVPRTIDLVNCTIYTNTAGGDGGGMQLEPTFTVNVLNTIVAGDSAGGNGPDIYGTINSQDYNLIQDTSGATINGTTTHNIIGADPLLGPLADNGGDTQTHALLPGSPAIDAVSVVSCTLPTDQRGAPRPADGDNDGTAACDIGAFEVQLPKIYLPIIMKNH